jgi:uncharacterized protein YheU (UPF0270 family)
VTNGGIINIPVTALSDEALLGVIDDYVNREGTDYGHQEIDLAQKRLAVRRALDSGRAVITYDPHSQTTTIVVPGTTPFPN